MFGVQHTLACVCAVLRCYVRIQRQSRVRAGKRENRNSIDAVKKIERAKKQKKQKKQTKDLFRWLNCCFCEFLVFAYVLLVRRLVPSFVRHPF